MEMETPGRFCQLLLRFCYYAVVVIKIKLSNFITVRDFRLSTLNRRSLRPSKVLRSINWYFLSDVSGQLVGNIFDVQKVQKVHLVTCIMYVLENGVT